MLNYNKLRCFTYIAKEKNISKASQLLFIGQPTLSVHMKDLEKELGVPLFIRKANALELTPAGALLYDRIHTFFEQEEQLIEDVRKAGNVKKSQIHIGTIGSAYINQLMDFVNEFETRHTDISVTIDRYSSDRLIDAIKEGTVDIAFNFNTDLVYHLKHIYQDYDHLTVDHAHMVAVVSKNHPLAGRRSVRLEELKDDSFAILDPQVSSFQYQSFLKQCRLAGFTPRITESYDYIEPMLTSVSLGSVITIVSTLAPFKGLDNISILLLEGKNPFEFNMYWQKNTQNTDIAGFVREFKEKKGLPRIKAVL